MIVYLDASALVKRYVAEAGSDELNHLVAIAEALGTSVISRAEVAAALAKAARVGLLARDEAGAALQVFYAQWRDLIRLQMTEAIAVHAGALAWEHELRGYHAVHLSMTLFWQEAVAEPVTLATFDRQLWHAGRQSGLTIWPEDVDRLSGL